MAAIPDPLPLWPLPSVAPRFWDESFGFQRPFSCTGEDCERWHAGVDLTDAQQGSRVIATEPCRLLRVGGAWKGSTTYICAQNAGSIAIYGGLEPGSWGSLAVGQELAAGAALGRIGSGYDDMLHFEIYELAAERTTNSRWWRGKPPPEGLMNPTNYLQAAARLPVTLATAPQRHEALKTLGFYAGPTFAPWTDASEAALKAAQAALLVDVDGVWGPATDAAVRARLGDRAPGAPPRRLAVAGAAVTVGLLLAGTVLLARRRRGDALVAGVLR